MASTSAASTVFVAACVLCGALNDPVSAQALIDTELEGQVDFRNEIYRPCLSQPACTINGVTVRAERRTEDGTAWLPAEIYWDMVDGLGIKDGAQNDEIDFDERLFVAFPAPRTVTKVWLSDLFRLEDPRYGSSDSDVVEGVEIDTESAVIQLSLADVTLDTILVDADDILPPEPFNQAVTLDFREEGDLRRRIVIVGDTVRIVVPGPDPTAPINFDGFTIGEIDPEKKSIFEGVETIEIDLTDILNEFNDTALFLVGTRNFEYVRSLTEDPETLANLRRVAEAQRQQIEISNGEFPVTFETRQVVDTVIFIAPFDASNEFSVSGIITE